MTWKSRETLRPSKVVQPQDKHVVALIALVSLLLVEVKLFSSTPRIAGYERTKGVLFGKQSLDHSGMLPRNS
jgi:hypothetical protein